MPDIEQHLHKLEHQITELRDVAAHLGQAHELEELLGLIRQPGWATAAELTFVSAILDSMRLQLHALEQLNRRLLAGARRVGTEPMDFELDIDDAIDARYTPQPGNIHPNQGTVQVT